MDSKLKIGIIISSTRPERFGDKPANWILEEANKKEEIEAEILDLRDYPMPFFEEVAPTMYLNGNYASKEGKRWGDKVKEFDGFIIVAAEYNHGYPAVLKNALDYAYAEWSKKPVAFISYGYSANGARSVAQLQNVVINLNMVPLSGAINISNFDLESVKEKGPGFIENLTWWTKLLKSAR